MQPEIRVSVPTVPEGVIPVLQLSLTVAPPKAPVKSLVLGLQSGTEEGGANVIIGLVVSLV